MKNVKLVICDIDGTLFDWTNRKLSPKTKEIITQLKQKGILFALASGRSVSELKPYAKEWGFDEQFDFLMGQNGAELYFPKEDKKYEYFLLKKEWIKEIIDFMEPFETNPFCFYHDEGMLCKVHDEMIDRSIATSKRKPIVAKDMSDFWSIENAKMMFRMKEELTPVVEKYLEEHPFEFYKGFKTQSTLIEFMDKRISKGYGLQQLCQLTNIPLEEVVAYGDTTNDNEMLQVAGLGVCLLNGSDDTKAIADEITKSVCTEDGFANHVEERIFPLIN
ncbi:MAG: HAD family phosphatase [Erysipelotrichaceae bacterium]|nr:HAD family phosphatase [Erysipelotrichaceae bacterium]